MSVAEPRILKRPSCVLLDMDNTLYRYAPAHAAGMDGAAMVASELLNIDRHGFEQAVAGARTELKRRLGPVAASHHRLLYFQRAIEQLGLASQVAAALKLDHAYWSHFLDAAELESEALDFLDDLRLLGIPVVIVTDLTAQIQFRKFLLWRLDRYVDWIVTSEEAGADKPDPRIFNLALAKLGGIEGQAWMIGDNPVADIEGAKDAVNALTIQMCLDEPHKPSTADHKVNGFAPLRALLRRASDTKETS